MSVVQRSDTSSSSSRRCRWTGGKGHLLGAETSQGVFVWMLSGAGTFSHGHVQPRCAGIPVSSSTNLPKTSRTTAQRSER